MEQQHRAHHKRLATFHASLCITWLSEDWGTGIERPVWGLPNPRPLMAGSSQQGHKKNSPQPKSAPQRQTLHRQQLNCCSGYCSLSVTPALQKQCASTSWGRHVSEGTWVWDISALELPWPEHPVTAALTPALPSVTSSE
eukprot:scaffold75498_cov23-Tisochrysis_lutea.AAC.1